jgi:hypothetical protein
MTVRLIRWCELGKTQRVRRLGDLRAYADGLRSAPRIGAEHDVPEGARTVVLSDTLVSGLAELLESME